eukprot:7251501-Prorocentrum_lima.AAC.1
MAFAEIRAWQTWWLSLQQGYLTAPGSWTTMTTRTTTTAGASQVDEEGVADPRRTAGPSSSNQGDSILDG